MTNFEYLKTKPDYLLAALLCGMFKCETCPFQDKKPEDEQMNCILYWFRQEHVPLEIRKAAETNDANG